MKTAATCVFSIALLCVCVLALRVEKVAGKKKFDSSVHSIAARYPLRNRTPSFFERARPSRKHVASNTARV